MTTSTNPTETAEKGVWPWIRDVFGRRPISLLLLALGVIFLLLGLTTGIDLPFLKHVAVDEGSRWFARILGLVLVVGGLVLLFRPGLAEAELAPAVDPTRSEVHSALADSIGVQELYLGLKEAWDPIIEAMSGARHRIQLVGISHRTNLGGEGFEEAIRRFLLEPESRVDVFFLNPQSEAIAQRAKAEDSDPETFRGEVLAGVQRTAAWRKAHPNKVHLFYYDAYPVWRLERIDDDVIFAHSYPPGSRGTMGAVMRLTRVENAGSMFAAFASILDRFEEGSEPVPEMPAP